MPLLWDITWHSSTGAGHRFRSVVPANDPGEDVGEAGLRIDVIELAGFDERGADFGRRFHAIVGTRFTPLRAAVSR